MMIQMSLFENTHFFTSTVNIINIYNFMKKLPVQFINKNYFKVLENVHYPISNVPYPAVTICNVNIISKKKAINMANNMYVKYIFIVND